MVTLDSSMRGEQSVHEVSERVFGFVVGGILVTLGSLPLLWGSPAKKGLWTLAVVLLVSGAVLPSILKWPKRIWFWVTGKIALVVNWVLLAVIFYGVLTPVAVFFRVTGRDPLKRRWDSRASSYWVIREAPSTSSMEHQY